MAKTSSSTSGKSRGNGNGGRNGSGRSSSSSEQAEKIDALDFLKAQHREVESLFEEFEDASASKQFKLAQTICEKLTAHAVIEEEIFYPAVRNKLKDQILEATEEHLSVKRIIADIEKLEAGDERLEAKGSVLNEQVSHHVEEEEDELFPKVKKFLSKEDREEMGQQLQQRFVQLQSRGNGADNARRSMGRGSDQREQASGRAMR